ncbi:MAG: cation:proton antiporter, partial [Gammaproteobacteria bacterium]|nr:cation:proton antiporter [Gammaproteobacteria bacterium]
PILLAMAKALAAVALMLAAGRWILRPFFHLVSAARYPELFTLAVLLVALAAAWLTSLLGLSLALGAFVAGLMLGETEYRHQIESDIRPFRDVLLGLFFITVGMQLDPRAAQHYGGWIALLVAGVVAGKGAVIAILTHLLGYGVRNAVRTGIVLGQGGEFGLALITLATTTALIRPEHSNVIITAIVATMVLAPFLVRHNERLAEALGARDAGGVAPGAAGASGIDAPARGGHVIICGYGRTGALTGRVLSEEGIPWVAIDPDPERVREAWQRGDSVVFGNARNPEVLDGANVSGARVLVVTFDDLNTATAVVRAARAARNDIPILVRARESAGLEHLMRAGATDGVPEAFETALMLALQLLLFMEVPTHAARRRIEAIQRSQYPLLGGFFQALETGAPQGTVPASHLHSLTLPAGASAVGQRLETLGLAQRGVVPVLVRRAGEWRVNADPDLVLQAGDVLIVHAEAEDFDRAERWLLRGEDGG